MGIQVVSYCCTLTDRLGRVISSTIARDVLLNPEADHLPLKALSKGMRDLRKGETRQIFLRAQEAYGFYDPGLVTTRALDESEMKTPFRIGEEVRVVNEDGTTAMRVIALSADSVTFDANHPLAGQDLIFEIQALEARDATPDEVDGPEILRLHVH